MNTVSHVVPLPYLYLLSNLKQRVRQRLNHHEVICEALEWRRLLQLCFEGHYRIVEPHVYGCDAQGRDLLLAYQLSGGGGHDNGTGWRLLDLSKVKSTKVLDMEFAGPRMQSGLDERAIRNVYCQV